MARWIRSVAVALLAALALAACSQSAQAAGEGEAVPSPAPASASLAEETPATVPVYRLLNEATGEHLLTADANERQTLQGIGWRDEGTAFDAYGGAGEAVYRLYNPYNDDHLYTTDPAEYAALPTSGWRQEGEQFFGSTDPDAAPVYRLHNPYLVANGGRGSHLWTVDAHEYQALGDGGWTREGVAWRAAAPAATPAPEPSGPYDGIYPEHEPYGTGVGAMPGRVVWAWDPESVEWDGSGYWWELDHFSEPAIRAMVDEGVASLAGADDAPSGWAALFAANRSARGLEGGYEPGQRIAIKANINGSAVMDDDTSGETAMSYTNPVLLKALLTSLVEEGGVAPANITVYDVSRLFPTYLVELCTAGPLEGVRFVDRNTGVADESAPIVWSHEFSGAVNYLPTCVTEADYLINLANLKGHSYGITLCGKNHFGSFINGNAMRPPEGANLHQWLTRNEMGIYSPLVDLMANADLGGKTVLYLLDALICAPSEGSSITAENATWEQAPFNGDYTSSVFLSQDPVAIDSVGADFLMAEPAVTSRNGALRDSPAVENYLHEAGLVASAPSGTTYTDGQGHAVTNLGVHEHWNNATDKLYSRNLGEPEGIELVQLTAP